MTTTDAVPKRFTSIAIYDDCTHLSHVYLDYVNNDGISHDFDTGNEETNEPLDEMRKPGAAQMLDTPGIIYGCVLRIS
jgi:hypothetical protein